jgi:hypothetical protein
MRFGDREGVLAELAEGFERMGLAQIAATCHVLAYTHSREAGWLAFGDGSNLPSLMRALNLDNRLATKLLADEVQRVVSQGQYGRYGVARELVSAFARLVTERREGAEPSANEAFPPSGLAFEMWDAAHSVISLRLPTQGDAEDLSLRYEPTPRHETTEAEGDVEPRPTTANGALAIVAMTGLAHPGCERKRRSLIAVRILAQELPGSLNGSLGDLIDQLDVPTLTWLLESLNSISPPPVEAIEAVAGNLTEAAQRDLLTIRSHSRQLLMAAGRTAPPLPAPRGATWDVEHLGPGEEPDEQATSMEARRVEGAVGTRIDRGDRIVSGFRRQVIDQAERQLRTELLKERLGRQLDDLGSRLRKTWPDAILADEETIETVLQGVASRGRAVVARQGLIQADPERWEADLAADTADSSFLALALEASRVPRPGYPQLSRPDESEEPLWQEGTHADASECPVVDNGPHEGWRVVGSVELHDHLGTYPEWISGRSSRACGIQLVTPGTEVPRRLVPLGVAQAEQWWNPPPWSDPRPDQPLVGLAEHQPTFLTRPVPLLVPLSALVHTLNLTPTLGRLAMTDAAGEAIRLRSWRALYQTSEYELARPSVRGSELIMRPDVFEHLQNAFGSRIVWHTSSLWSPPGDFDA